MPLYHCFILQSCFAFHGFIKQFRLLHELGLLITHTFRIVLNPAHNRAPFLGLVGQLHRKKNLLFRMSGFKGRLVFLVVLRAHDLLQISNEPIKTSRWERGTGPDAAASTKPTGKGWFKGGKFCVVPVGGTGLGFER